jgi:hypothetical protein
MNQLDVSVKYEFPKGFQPEIVKGLGELIERNILTFDLGRKMLSIRERDLSTEVTSALNSTITEIRQFMFENQATLDSPLPFVTSSKKDVTELRRSVHDTVYRIVSYFRDFEVALKLQLFQLSNMPNFTTDANVTHRSATGAEVDSPEAMIAKVAISNLQEVQRYFASLETSTAMKGLLDAVSILEVIEPTVSFGGIKFEADTAVFRQLDVVAF